MEQKRRFQESGFWLLIILTIALFTIELGIMFVFAYLPALPMLAEAVADSSILVILCFPVLLYFVFRPLKIEISNRKKAEQALAREKEFLDVTFQSIGDGIIATDTKARITLINRVAEALTGWSEKEAIGKPLEEVFQIINEETRQRCPNPVERVLSTGAVIGLGNHTILISRDKTEYFLGDSAAPIRDNAGNITGVVLVFRDITSLRQIQEELNRENEFNKILIQSIPLGVDIVDEEGNILYISDKLKVQFGKEVEGKKCFQLYRDDKRQCPACPLRKGIGIGETATVEVKGCLAGRTLQIVHYGMLYEKKKMIFEIFNDITEAKELEERLEKANQDLVQSQKATLNMLEDLGQAKGALEEANLELKRLSQLKSDFVSTVSHELRTPLTTMKEFTAIILDEIPGRLTSEQREYLDIVENNINRLARLINDLLDISKIEAGKVELKKKSLSLTDLVNSVVSTLKPEADKKHIKIDLLCPESVSCVFADLDKINQVFTNLIGNSIKFTPENGQITVEIIEKEKEIECSVADTGIGISNEDLPKVFGKFQQFSRTPGPGAKGTGLGLAITKELVQMHNGKIWVESKLGKGSKFTLALSKYTEELTFKEYVNNRIKEAAEKDSKMSLITISILEPEKLKREFPDEELQLMLKDMEDILENSLRKTGDVTVRDTGDIFIILIGCDKENALRVEGRLQQALEDYLASKELTKKIKFRMGHATYPDEANNEEELIKKAKKS